MTHPAVVKAARQITADCESRNDMCELEAIYDAVKTGTDAVPGLRRGVRYVSDPRDTDFFTAPATLLELCAEGACQEDCDGHAALIAALCGALGFAVGLRAYGESKDNYEHVYAVVGLPKHFLVTPSQIVGMDTTVKSAYVGWEPPEAAVETAWIY